MQIPRISIEKSDLVTLFRIYRKTIAYCLIAIVIYSIVDKAANNFATKPVIVASKELAAGSVLVETDLKEIRIPQSAIVANSLAKTELVGKMLSANIAPDEQLTSTRVIASNHVISDQRVVGVRIIDSEIASILRPGSLVDVVKLNNSNGIYGGVIAKNVSVIAIASKKSSFGSSAGSVVMVSTNNDTAVTLAINSGEKLTVLLH
ncbi:MAG: SAF domain-containing protein [Candidatus Nanopelagicales bacterium]|nr:SAF domain-containing protein [Candidatus Nanopelagicales bacterium]